jgi:hypothetical protein
LVVDAKSREQLKLHRISAVQQLQTPGYHIARFVVDEYGRAVFFFMCAGLYFKSSTEVGMIL